MNTPLTQNILTQLFSWPWGTARGIERINASEVLLMIITRLNLCVDQCVLLRGFPRTSQWLRVQLLLAHTHRCTAAWGCSSAENRAGCCWQCTASPGAPPVPALRCRGMPAACTAGLVHTDRFWSTGAGNQGIWEQQLKEGMTCTDPSASSPCAQMQHCMCYVGSASPPLPWAYFLVSPVHFDHQSPSLALSSDPQSGFSQNCLHFVCFLKETVHVQTHAMGMVGTAEAEFQQTAAIRVHPAQWEQGQQHLPMHPCEDNAFGCSLYLTLTCFAIQLNRASLERVFNATHAELNLPLMSSSTS